MGVAKTRSDVGVTTVGCGGRGVLIVLQAIPMLAISRIRPSTYRLAAVCAPDKYWDWGNIDID